ncbi:MAG: hypothetical protein O2944_04315 [Proteobacteria bacterium]|nr:hypothetical protein [Pseudomonadota bacterium]
MSDRFGISTDGLKAALAIKQSYGRHEPLLIPGEEDRLLVPENLLNRDIDLHDFEDPLALAVMCARDPESPMALAAAARLCPIGNRTELVAGVFSIVADTSRHELVRECLRHVSEHAFEPDSIARITKHASHFVFESRQQFTAALRDNLKCLLDGEVAPRQFVREFFELTEAGNLRNDIRKKLVLSILLSVSVRPSIKFLMLENFHRLAKPVRLGIISAVLKAEPTRHSEFIKEELRYIVVQEKALQDGLDLNGRPAPKPGLKVKMAPPPAFLSKQKFQPKVGDPPTQRYWFQI